MTDQEILAALKTDKRHKALEEIYTHYSKIRALILKMNGTDEDAKDIFQESIVILFEKAQTNFTLSASISTYLYAVSRNLWTVRLRKTSLSLSSEDLSMLEFEDDVIEYNNQESKFLIIERTLQSIGERCKAVLQYFYYEKMSMQSLALKLGFANEKTARNQKYKCLEKARKLATRKYKEEGLAL